MRTDARAIHDDRAHANQAVVADMRPVRDGAVAQGYAVPDDQRQIGIGMADGAILDIAAGADDYGLAFAAQHRVEPDARIRAQRHIADDDRARCDEGAWVDSMRLESGVVGFHSIWGRATGSPVQILQFAS